MLIYLCSQVERFALVRVCVCVCARAHACGVCVCARARACGCTHSQCLLPPTHCFFDVCKTTTLLGQKYALGIVNIKQPVSVVHAVYEIAVE